MKKILYNICIMIIIIICPINVWASDDLIVINDQEKINIEYVEFLMIQNCFRENIRFL